MFEINVTKENFDEVVLGAKNTVLVDFWAEWCGPCRMLAPVIAEIAEENAEVTVCKVNVDEEPELSDAFQVASIPTLVVFKDGKEVNRALGFMPKSKVLALL